VRATAKLRFLSCAPMHLRNVLIGREALGTQRGKHLLEAIVRRNEDVDIDVDRTARRRVETEGQCAADRVRQSVAVHRASSAALSCGSGTRRITRKASQMAPRGRRNGSLARQQRVAVFRPFENLHGGTAGKCYGARAVVE
jgi:hypothetical protein